MTIAQWKKKKDAEIRSLRGKLQAAKRTIEHDRTWIIRERAASSEHEQRLQRRINELEDAVQAAIDIHGGELSPSTYRIFDLGMEARLFPGGKPQAAEPAKAK